MTLLFVLVSILKLGCKNMSGSSITESKDCCKSISKNIGSIICSTIENLSKIEIDY